MYYFRNTSLPYYYYTDGYNLPIPQQGQEDERFFGFGILPFVAGLAVAPLLFNRPCCPPYPPYPPPYGYFPQPYPYPQSFQPQPFNPVYGNTQETINIYT